MRKTERKIFSVILVLNIMVMLFAAVFPKEVQAAAPKIKSLKGKGSSSVTISDAECSKTNYIKFKAGVTGYITVKMQNTSKTAAYAGANISLCDKNKKVIGQKNERWTTDPQTAGAYQTLLAKYDINFKKANCYTRTYGIKKNTTYYFAVKSSAGIKLTANVTAVAKGSNSSLAKAKTLSKNKKAEGVMIAGDSTADWYKITLSKSAKIQLIYTAKTNGTIAIPDDKMGILVSFYKSDGTLFYEKGKEKSEDYLSDVVPSRWFRFYRLDSKGKELGLDAGTYYVRVQRLTKRSSGQYTLKWRTFT